MSYKAYANVRLHTAHTSLLCCSGLLKCRCTAGFGPGLREGVCVAVDRVSRVPFLYMAVTRAQPVSGLSERLTHTLFRL